MTYLVYHMIPNIQEKLDNFDRDVTLTPVEYLWCIGKPQSKQSARFGKKRSWTSKDKVAFVEGLAKDISSSLKGGRIVGNVALTVLYCFPWRVSDKDKVNWALMGSRPDIDNCMKPLFDSMNKECLSDDSVIVQVKARKIRYTVSCIAVRVDHVSENYVKS